MKALANILAVEGLSEVPVSASLAAGLWDCDPLLKPALCRLGLFNPYLHMSSLDITVASHDGLCGRAAVLRKTRARFCEILPPFQRHCSLTYARCFEVTHICDIPRRLYRYEPSIREMLGEETKQVLVCPHSRKQIQSVA
jgi:hypothetical protein